MGISGGVGIEKDEEKGIEKGLVELELKKDEGGELWEEGGLWGVVGLVLRGRKIFVVEVGSGVVDCNGEWWYGKWSLWNVIFLL